MSNRNPAAAPALFTCIALDPTAATRIAANCIESSRWFEVTPLPEDAYRIVMKDEPGVREIFARCR